MAEWVDHGLFVYKWGPYTIRKVPIAASYIDQPSSANTPTAWGAYRNGELIFRHSDLDTVKAHCENVEP